MLHRSQRPFRPLAPVPARRARARVRRHARARRHAQRPSAAQGGACRNSAACSPPRCPARAARARATRAARNAGGDAPHDSSASAPDAPDAPDSPAPITGAHATLRLPSMHSRGRPGARALGSAGPGRTATALRGSPQLREVQRRVSVRPSADCPGRACRVIRRTEAGCPSRRRTVRPDGRAGGDGQDPPWARRSARGYRWPRRPARPDAAGQTALRTLPCTLRRPGSRQRNCAAPPGVAGSQ